MAMHWRLVARGPALAANVLWVFLIVLLGVPLLAGCQQDDDELFRPGDVQTNVLTALYVPSDLLRTRPIEINGEIKDLEWAWSADWPFTQVQVTSEEGNGDPGEPKYVSMKAIYTETDLFLLIRWADPRADREKNPFVYVGPDLPDSLTGPGAPCASVLEDERAWRIATESDEDRLMLAWEIGGRAGDGLGSYRDQGCQIACHPGSVPGYGRTGYGRLDVWQWLACRTDPLRNLYDPFDNANFPLYGIPGYLDDYAADSLAGLVPDPGRAGWQPNSRPGGGTVPRWIYRTANDPFFRPGDPNNCFSAFGERCRENNGLPQYYIWREDITRVPPEFDQCDVLNEAVLPTGSESRVWESGDRVGAYFYVYPTESRADVRGKAAFVEGIWTLEVGRRLQTGDPANDVTFSGVPGEQTVFTLAIADNSASRHWGSRPQVLQFGPKCAIDPPALDFGAVPFGSTKDLTFTIQNPGLGDLPGNVTEACGAFTIVSGGGAFRLTAGQSREVTVRFAPTAVGLQTCEIETGLAGCGRVSCTGEGVATRSATETGVVGAAGAGDGQ